MKRFMSAPAARIRGARVVVKIALRNLLRQFCRNLLLGIGIAVSMCILVVTTAYTSGLADILFNKVLVYWTGHIRVIEDSYVTRRSDVIREKARFNAVIRKSVPGLKSVNEVATAYSRAIGNGRTSLLVLIGAERSRKDFYTKRAMVSGDPRDIFKPDVFPGILLYSNTARDLNVKLGDTVTARFDTIYGQSQAPKLKVVGIIPSQNIFQDTGAFIDMDTLKGLLNMKSDEAMALNIVTTYPEDRQRVIAAANALHAALAPEAAGIKAQLSAVGPRAGTTSAAADMFALRLDGATAAQAVTKDNLQFIAGDLESFSAAKDGIILTEALASALNAKVGSTVGFSYEAKEGGTISDEVVVKGIVKPVSPFAAATAFANENVFYKSFFWNIPREPALVAHDAPLFKALLPEWDLMQRSSTTDEQMKKERLLGREAWKGAKVDVQTMFETASVIVDFQRGLNTVGIVAVLVLFFVILIGVVNTMRMSIRERTREIGTNRAIGMQRGDVRSVFVMEIVLLAVLASLVGVLLAWGLMTLLSVPTFDLRDNPFSMFFVQKHLYFLPKAGTIIVNFVTIVLVAFVIAFFSARRAAKMRVADALRHYE